MNGSASCLRSKGARKAISKLRSKEESTVNEEIPFSRSHSWHAGFSSTVAPGHSLLLEPLAFLAQEGAHGRALPLE